MTAYSFPRYLAAKKSIDDRALNQQVWETMARVARPVASGQPLRVLEIGCGIGTMLDRLVERGIGILHSKAANLPQLHYTGIDSDPENIAQARQRFSQSLITDYRSPITFLNADLFALPSSLPSNSFDLLIAHAFLDLVDVPRALPILFSYLRPNGVFYFTLNFDGVTIFQPEHPLDSIILSLYHRTMDDRLTEGNRSGDSRTGRHLFTHLKNAAVNILAAGSSDWVVFPGRDGYPEDEAYFLHHILYFFEQSLRKHPDLNQDQLSIWLAARRTQIMKGELVYIAHQLDVAGNI